jgi:hypothetical protein
MSSIAIAYTFVTSASATLSLIASSTILYKIYKSPTKLKSPYTRFLSGLSAYDILYSLPLFVSSLASPSGTSWGSIGNIWTCNIQGFVLLLGQFGASFYNFGLCLYYLCIIKYSMPDERFSYSVEPYLHAFPLVFGLFIATYAVSTGNINPSGLNGETYFCYISPLPLRCPQDAGIDCVRGENAPLLQWILVFGPMMISAVGMFTALGMICMAVREQENRMEQYVFRLRDGQPASRRSSNANGPSRNRKVQMQAISYVAAIAICYIPISLIVFTSSPLIADSEGPLSIRPEIIILQGLLSPLQGLFNVIVYLRPQVCNIKRDNPERGWVESVLIAINTVDIADNRERSRRMRRSSRHTESIGRINSRKRWMS